jgi:hypothetical protein
MLASRPVAMATTPGTAGLPEVTLCSMASAAAFRFGFVEVESVIVGLLIVVV